LLDEALSLIDAEEDPRLAATARHNRLLALAESGDFQRASELHLQSGLRQAFADDPLNLLQLRVVEAKLLAGRNKLARASAAFEEVHAEFLARNRTYDAALVGLELAEVWLKQGKNPLVRRIAAEKLVAFDELGVEAEARRALAYLHEACLGEYVTAATITSVRRFLIRSQWRAGLEFEAG
jgi:hypothetical protein